MWRSPALQRPERLTKRGATTRARILDWSLQGGYLLARAAHDTTPMAVALDMAIEHVKGLAA